MAAKNRGFARFEPWIDFFAPLLAIGGMAATLSETYVRVHTLDMAASDFKTVIASARLFGQNHNPYDAQLLSQVLTHDGITQPREWFGHMPVYPPCTLALLAPFARLPMAFTCWAALIIDTLLLAVAVALLMRWSREHLRLPLLARLGVIGLCGACPLMSFGLTMANLAMPAAAFCIIACVLEDRQFLRGVLLALALLLKPHLALWVVVALFLQKREDHRQSAILGVVGVAAFVACISLWSLLTGHLIPDWRDFIGMIHAERSASASMNDTIHIALPLKYQITSLSFLIGYLTNQTALRLLSFAVWVPLAAVLATVQVRSRGETPLQPVLYAAAWSAVGMIATYHREYDAVILFLALPVMMAAFLRPGLRALGAGILVCTAFSWYEIFPHGFWEARQGAVAFLGLAVCLVALAALEKRQKKPVPTV